MKAKRETNKQTPNRSQKGQTLVIFIGQIGKADSNVGASNTVVYLIWLLIRER